MKGIYNQLEFNNMKMRRYQRLMLLLRNYEILLNEKKRWNNNKNNKNKKKVQKV